MNENNTIPTWNLQSLYPSFNSNEYRHAVKEFERYIASFMQHVETPFRRDEFADWLLKSTHLQNEVGTLHESLWSYASASYSVATTDTSALNEMNRLQKIALTLKHSSVIFRNILAENRSLIEQSYKVHPQLRSYEMIFKEDLFEQSKQLSAEMEHLAEDLKRSGSEAWSRLQEQITSNLSIIWDEKSGERKTLNELRNMAHHHDRSLRARAFEKELEVLRSVQLPIAAALSGVKGTSLTLDARRAWESSIAKSIFQSRITEKTLSALITAMEESLPFWQRYLHDKAKLLDIPQCAFYDIYAPVGTISSEWSYKDAENTIVEQFSQFSPKMGDFARHAFDNQWIDAKVRNGKVGGAYCTGFPVQKESRILSNFIGNYSDVTTLAHELGHAYHQEVLKNTPYMLTQYPMTLAETASIFAETIVFKSVSAKASGDEKKALIEAHLQDGCQIIVDILSRYYFESDFFALRQKGEVSAEECCALMLEAQERTYGNGLKSDERHPLMWAVKGHYYQTGLDFYNFPYAFGLLFALSLYARYEKEGALFADTYNELLADTGRFDCVSLCKKSGFDIETVAFWRAGLSIFESDLRDLEAL